MLPFSVRVLQKIVCTGEKGDIKAGHLNRIVKTSFKRSTMALSNDPQNQLLTNMYTYFLATRLELLTYFVEMFPCFVGYLLEDLE